MGIIYILLSIILAVLAGYLFLVVANNEPAYLSVADKFPFLWFLLIGNLLYFACYFFFDCREVSLFEGEGEMSYMTPFNIFVFDSVIVFVYLFIKGLIVYIRIKKINDAIRYGVIGTKPLSLDYGKIYLIRKNNCTNPYQIRPTLDSQEYNNSVYSHFIVYDNETRKSVAILSEEEVLDMLKLRRDKNHQAPYRNFTILKDAFLYGTWGASAEEQFKKIMETEKCPFCGKPLANVKYTYTREVNSGFDDLLVYQGCCEHTKDAIENIRNRIHK